MDNNLGYIVKSRETVYLDINRVLKNTYMLLSATIFFSALIAFLSIEFNVGGVNFLFVFLISIGFLFLINIFKNSIFGLFFVFAFTGFLGYTIGPILNHFLSMKNGKELVVFSLFSTGFAFSVLSLYVLFTKKNFEFLNGFLCIGFAVVFLCIIMSFFIHIQMLHLVLSGFIVILSSAMILYDTSRIINGGETNYILATVSLFLSIYNMFLSLLHIFDFLSSRD